MFSDTRLQSLQGELDSLHRAQSDARKEIERLQNSRDAKMEQIRRDYDNDIAGYERKYGTASSRIPDITRQIDTRQRELQRELERSAANTNSAPAKKSGWM